MTKAWASTILITAMAVAGAFADPGAASLVSPEIYQRLRTGEEVKHSLGGSTPELVPRIDGAKQIVRELRELDVTMGVEVLRLYAPQGTGLDAPEARLAIYNILHSVSSMEGIEYYSVTRGRMRTLFAQSYAVADPESLRRIPDPVFTRIPPYNEQYIFQEDLTFGRNVYRAEYLARDAGFILTYRNLTQMRYYFIPAVKPDDSLTVIMVIPQGRELLFYGVMAAHSVSFFGLERSREESFYNRLNALYGWFTREMAARVEVLSRG
jgi:hypothetical protein